MAQAGVQVDLQAVGVGTGVQAGFSPPLLFCFVFGATLQPTSPTPHHQESAPNPVPVPLPGTAAGDSPRWLMWGPQSPPHRMEAWLPFKGACVA